MYTLLTVDQRAIKMGKALEKIYEGEMSRFESGTFLDLDGNKAHLKRREQHYQD